MDLEYLAKYPFTPDAKKHVDGLGLSITELLEHPVYSACLESGRARIAGLFEGNYKPPLGDKLSQELTILSYPIARVIAHATKDRGLLNKYAGAEAELVRKILSREKPDNAASLAEQLGLKISGGKISYISFLKLTSSLNEPNWLLVNRTVEDGMVEVEDEEIPRLVGQFVKNKILEPLSLKDVPNKLITTANIVKTQYSSYDHVKVEELEDGALPPCVKAIVSQLEQGTTNHQGMFTLATFLINLGLAKNQILSVFKKSPKYKEDLASYQIEFLSGEKSGTEYSCPSCASLKSSGLCRAECNVKHPLQFYRNNMKRKPPAKLMKKKK